jgi:Fuseless
MLKEIKESSKLKELKALHPSANVLVIIFAIIMVWRGIWGLLDIYFFPGYPAFSHLTCLVIGAAILYLDDFRIDNLKR